jgi:SAM-dependent methyltransferase
MKEIEHKDPAFEWYSKQVKKYGVADPRVVGYSGTRKESVDYQLFNLKRIPFKLKGKSVVEFGCGNLMTWEALHQLGVQKKDYTGVEIVPEFIAYGKEIGVKVLPKIKGTFDVGFLIENYASRNAVAEARKVTKWFAKYLTQYMVVVYTTSEEEGLGCVPPADMFRQLFPEATIRIEFLPDPQHVALVIIDFSQ